MEYGKLRGRIVEVYGKYGEFAKAMGWSRQTLSNKLAHKTEFTQTEILKVCEVLDIDLADIGIYFFTPRVQHN